MNKSPFEFAGWQGNYSAYIAPVHKDKNDINYLKECGIVLFSNTNYLPDGPIYMDICLDDMDPAWNGYSTNMYYSRTPFSSEAVSTKNEKVIKHAAQGCYQSYSPKGTSNAQGKKYFDNILEQEHGSVLEHAFVGLFIYGIPRDCSHEIVRHRVGTAFSQVSQRYVDSSHLRFVMRSEIQGDKDLEDHFFDCIDNAHYQYKLLEDELKERSAKSSTRTRKVTQQMARTVLPNCTETQMTLTGNLRFWRHFLVKRGSEHADTPVRELAVKCLPMLHTQAPLVFNDFEEKISELDGNPYLVSKYGSV